MIKQNVLRRGWPAVMPALGFALGMVFLFLPVVILVDMMLTPPARFYARQGPILFDAIGWDNILALGQMPESWIWSPVMRSVAVGLAAAVLSVGLGAPAAYRISRLSLRARLMWMSGLFIGRMVPEVAVALPLAVNFLKLGLADTWLGLTLAHTVRLLPVVTVVLIGVFESFPRQIEEQAAVDGCSSNGVLFRIVLPCCVPHLAAAGLLGFLFSWDEFVYAMFLTFAKPTVPVQIYTMLQRGDLFVTAAYAGLVCVPAFWAGVFIQRVMRPDALAGGIHG